jgi:hypothetical protein
MTGECDAGRREFQPIRDAVDVAVEGLHHAEDELAHAFTPRIDVRRDDLRCSGLEGDRWTSPRQRGCEA